MKKYRVRVVKSWRKIPVRHREVNDSKLLGYSDPKSGNIWVLKDAPKGTYEHELYHSHKRHPDVPRLYSAHIDHELEADMFAYKEVGRPKRVVGSLTALFNTCIPYIRKGQCTALQVVKRIKNKLIELDAPSSWIEDYDSLFKKVVKAGWIKNK
jgi:hypothetical protein